MKRDLALFVRLLKLAAPFAGWMAFTALLGFATVASGIGLMATSAWLIASAALHPSIADLQVAIVGVRFFGIARGGFRYLERYTSHQVTFRLLARLRVAFYEMVEPLAPAGLSQQHSGDLLSRAIADIESLQNFFGRVIAPPLVAFLIGLSVWLFARGFDANLANVWLLSLVCAGLGVPIITRASSRRPGRRIVARRAELNATLVEGIQANADLLAFGQENQWLERVRNYSRDLTELQTRMARITALDGALGILLTGLCGIAVLVVAIPLVQVGLLDGVYLPVLVLAALASFEAVLPLPSAAQHLESSLRATQRLFEWDIPTGRNKHAEEIRDATSRATPATAQCAISVRGLSFGYTPGARLALDRLDFDVPVGGRLAIVGPSGAGKSTFLNVLFRFWEYNHGSVMLFGRELRDVPPDEVRRMVGVVAQNTYLFNATIRENLLIARPNATQADLDRVIVQAQLDKFIQTLPDGYETWVGEQGLLLSGGERQRLAIARALLKDASILVLDEATENLDALSERAIMQAIHTLMEGRTTLIVTHRLAGLETADEILVLRKGQIVKRESRLNPHCQSPGNTI